MLSKNISPSNPDNTMMQLGTNNALCPKRSAIGPKINEPASMPMGRKVTSDVVCSPLNSSFVTREGSTEPNVIIETEKTHSDARCREHKILMITAIHTNVFFDGRNILLCLSILYTKL